jgi:hypothetical protein
MLLYRSIRSYLWSYQVYSSHAIDNKCARPEVWRDICSELQNTLPRRYLWLRSRNLLSVGVCCAQGSYASPCISSQPYNLSQIHAPVFTVWAEETKGNKMYLWTCTTTLPAQRRGSSSVTLLRNGRENTLLEACGHNWCRSVFGIKTYVQFPLQ